MAGVNEGQIRVLDGCELIPLPSQVTNMPVVQHGSGGTCSVPAADWQLILQNPEIQT